MPRLQHSYIAHTRTISALARIVVLTTAFLLLVSGNVIAESNTYNQALDAYNNKDYETALPIWRNWRPKATLTPNTRSVSPTLKEKVFLEISTTP